MVGRGRWVADGLAGEVSWCEAEVGELVGPLDMVIEGGVAGVVLRRAAVEHCFAFELPPLARVGSRSKVSRDVGPHPSSSSAHCRKKVRNLGRSFSAIGMSSSVNRSR
jgi:hypothetical protein